MAPQPARAGTPSITLTWFIAPSRWAPETLLPLLGAFAPEALPLDYADFGTGSHWWHGQDGQGSWDEPGYARVHHFSPQDAAEVGVESVTFDAHDVGQLQVILGEASIDRAAALFDAASPALGAFFAAGQRWERNHEPEHFLNGVRWQGLPPMAMWRAWFGPPYLELVEPHIAGDRHPAGLLVRDPTEWTLPPELTYTPRPPIHHENGGITVVPAVDEDRASVIPPIE
ncbi:hypothetical protein OJ998_10640 [Solirubrobacter taibaiensis]|nr:hypothetical protein [Solirubrobacter taibaiensis]